MNSIHIYVIFVTDKCSHTYIIYTMSKYWNRSEWAINVGFKLFFLIGFCRKTGKWILSKKNEKKSLKYVFLQNLCLKLAESFFCYIRETNILCARFFTGVQKKTFSCAEEKVLECTAANIRVQTIKNPSIINIFLSFSQK